MIRGFLIFFFLIMILDTALASAFLPPAFEGEFIQEKKLLKSVEKTQIILKYQFPNNIYFKDSKTNTLYICNKEKVYKYDPPFIEGEAGNVAIGDSSRFCFVRIFDSLRPGLKNNPNYMVKAIKGIEVLEFTAKGIKNTGIKRINLQFNSKSKKFSDIKSMEIFLEDDSKPLKLVSKSITLREKFPAKTFQFDIPKKALIERMK